MSSSHLLVDEHLYAPCASLHIICHVSLWKTEEKIISIPNLLHIVSCKWFSCYDMTYRKLWNNDTIKFQSNDMAFLLLYLQFCSLQHFVLYTTYNSPLWSHRIYLVTASIQYREAFGHPKQLHSWLYTWLVGCRKWGQRVSGCNECHLL